MDILGAIGDMLGVRNATSAPEKKTIEALKLEEAEVIKEEVQDDLCDKLKKKNCPGDTGKSASYNTRDANLLFHKNVP